MKIMIIFVLFLELGLPQLVFANLGEDETVVQSETQPPQKKWLLGGDLGFYTTPYDTSADESSWDSKPIKSPSVSINVLRILPYDETFSFLLGIEANYLKSVSELNANSNVKIESSGLIVSLLVVAYFQPEFLGNARFGVSYDYGVIDLVDTELHTANLTKKLETEETKMNRFGILFSFMKTSSLQPYVVFKEGPTSYSFGVFYEI